MDIVIILFKMGLLYLLLLITYRLMGKRKINDFSLLDLIIFILFANTITFTLPIKEPYMYTLIAISVLILLQILMTYIGPKIPTLKYLLEGVPTIIITKGKLDFKEMLKRRCHIEELLAELKAKGINNIEDVEYAIIDNNGKLSTFGHNKKDNGDIPLPIILDGKIQYMILKLLHKDNDWVNKMLSNDGVLLNNVFYAFYQQGKFYVIRNNNS